MRNLKPCPTASPSVCQLPLPWVEDPPTPPLPPPPPMLRPQEIWASLSPTQKTQVRQTILHILQEVFNDRAHS